jgi:hypothetical protein
MEKRQEYMKGYMQNYRKEQKLLADGKRLRKYLRKQNVNNTDILSISESESSESNKTTTNTGVVGGFDSFWAAYPNRKAKPAALKAFIKLKVDSVLLDTILKAIEKQKCSEQWVKDGGKFIPFPATWLNQKRWEDEDERGTNGSGNAGEHGRFSEYSHPI